MKLAAIQYKPPKGQPERAREELAALIAEAGRQGAGLVVCPEMATTGYVWESGAQLRPFAEPAHGPTFQRLAVEALRHRTWIVCGFAELGADGMYNSALIIDPDGRLARCYRKVLLYEADTTWARPGRQRHLVHSALGTISPSICMDINDPGHTWHLAVNRPDICAFCTNWVDEGQEILPYWRERLGSWRGWFVAADTWGVDCDTRFYGRSVIMSPDWKVMAMADAEGDAVLVVEVPDQEVPALR